MRWLRPSSEPEMSALLLQQELASERFGSPIVEHVEREGLPRRLITRPELANAHEQAKRRYLLHLHRGYGTEYGHYLSAFPTAGVRWDWAALGPDELERVKSILVTAQEQGGLVVFEGHVRLTAYVLARDALPPELEVLVGSSPAVARWPDYEGSQGKGVMG